MSTQDLVLDVTQSVQIAASPERVFAAVLERLGPGSRMPDGTAMPMTIEPFPGGRWFRDLGDDTGHLWGHVQVIKPPRLLEVHGPLFMSFAATSHVQWRIEETDGGSRLSVHQQTLGVIADEIREGLNVGWTNLVNDVRGLCE